MIKQCIAALALGVALSPALAFIGDDQEAMARDGDYMLVRVIGYDCDGARGPLLASDEDMLPRCERIEAIPPYAVPLTLEAGAE